MTQLEEAETAFYYLKKTRRRFFTEFLDFLVILIRNMAIAKVNNANLNIWMQSIDWWKNIHISNMWCAGNDKQLFLCSCETDLTFMISKHKPKIQQFIQKFTEYTIQKTLCRRRAKHGAKSDLLKWGLNYGNTPVGLQLLVELFW